MMKGMFVLIKKLFSQNKTLTKHQVLRHFIKTADQNAISRYYFDPYFQDIPHTILLEYIKELSEEGYLKPMQRHVVLKAKAYSYLSERRQNKIEKFLSYLGRPISCLIAWILGILSTVLAEYLIRLIFAKP